MMKTAYIAKDCVEHINLSQIENLLADNNFHLYNRTRSHLVLHIGK